MLCDQTLLAQRPLSLSLLVGDSRGLQIGLLMSFLKVCKSPLCSMYFKQTEIIGLGLDTISHLSLREEF